MFCYFLAASHIFCEIKGTFHGTSHGARSGNRFMFTGRLRNVRTLPCLNLTEGNTIITATAVDRADNEAKPLVVTVVLDTTPPGPATLKSLRRLPGFPR